MSETVNDKQYWINAFRVVYEQAVKASEAKKQKLAESADVDGSKPQNIFSLTIAETEAGVGTEILNNNQNQDTFNTVNSDRTEEERAQKIAEAKRIIAENTLPLQFADWNKDEDEWYKNFLEFRKNRPDWVEQCNKLKSEGKSDAEILAYLGDEERTFVRQDAEYLREEFEKNPQLRLKMQENFDKLSPAEQKTLFYEATMSGRKPDKQELLRMLANLSSAKDGVKIFALTAYRIEHPDKANQISQLAKVVDANEVILNDAYEYMSEKNQIGCAKYMSKFGSEKSFAEFADTAHKAQKNAAEQVAEAICDSKLLKERPDIQKKLAANTDKWEQPVRTDVYKKFYDSDSFGTEGKNALIDNIKDFDSDKEQLQLANHVNDSEKTEEQNRVQLASQIKSFSPSVQMSFAKAFMQNQKNQTEAIMKTLTNEISNLQIDDKSKSELLNLIKDTDKINQGTIDKIKNILLTTKNEDKSLKLTQQMAKNEIIKIILLLTNGTGEFVNTVVNDDSSNKATALTAFIYLLDKGTITPERVVAAGYKKVLKANFLALTRASQEQIFDMLSADEISEMWEKGEIPKRFEDRVMAKLSKNMTTKVASQLGRTSSFTELVNFEKNADSSKYQTIFKNALKDRFSDRLEDAGGGLIA